MSTQEAARASKSARPVPVGETVGASRVLVLLRRLRAGLARLDAGTSISFKLLVPIAVLGVAGSLYTSWHIAGSVRSQLEEELDEQAALIAEGIKADIFANQEHTAPDELLSAVQAHIDALLAEEASVLRVNLYGTVAGRPAVIASSDSESIGPAGVALREEAEELKQAFRSQEAFYGTVVVEGQRAREAVVPIQVPGQPPMAVGAYISTAEQDADVASLIRTCLTGTLGTLAVILVIIVGLMRFVTVSRQRRLLAATARMQAGDYTARVEGVSVVEPRDEILLISSRFNAMADAIETLHQEIIEQARTDALTGLHNRRYAMEALERELHQARRSGEPLSVIVVDLDKLKELNDTCCHLAGDDALRLVARTLQKTIRAGDIPSRFGGDEFLIVLPACDGEVLSSILERIQAETQDVECPYDNMAEPRPITLSGGGTTLRLGDTVDSLIQRADAALLEAKRAGRNQVRVAA